MYLPAEGDPVVGIVDDRGEAYRVELPGAPFPGLLGVLSFDGATKRNRPNLQIGDAVYCQVAAANPNVEPQLTCASEGKGWMTGEARFGKLAKDKTTCIVRCSPKLCAVLETTHPLLPALRRHFGGDDDGGGGGFKLAIGANGAVWIRAAKTLDTTCIANAILNADKLDDPTEVPPMVDRLVAAVNADHTIAGRFAATT
ncbi:hypothetical protein CTAYLR_006162 [Chrysophaeum taylorii]|uniref:Ribosomal RNA-processing protein 40 n=1 Tax=Chrysophaeum taylorii TaxID=2483200 RepID=A0AAD7XQC2_9STRA|nr:hypothetical protein CTAYLR_006162 [Chrysophaeum taylorii]